MAFPPMIYRRDADGDLMRYADDLPQLKMPVLPEGELFTILVDVLMEENARRLAKVFEFVFRSRLEWGGRITSGQVDKFAETYDNVDPWQDL